MRNSVLGVYSFKIGKTAIEKKTVNMHTFIMLPKEINIINATVLAVREILACKFDTFVMPGLIISFQVPAFVNKIH